MVLALREFYDMDGVTVNITDSGFLLLKEGKKKEKFRRGQCGVKKVKMGTGKNVSLSIFQRITSLMPTYNDGFHFIFHIVMLLDRGQQEFYCSQRYRFDRNRF